MHERARRAWSTALALALVSALAAPEARADTTVRHHIQGRPHEFLVPQGWTSSEISAGVRFAPPPGRVAADFSCGLIAIEGVMDRDPIAFVQALADDEVRQNMPWAKPTQPTSAWMLGVQGGLILIIGTNPQGQQRATVYLVVGANGLIYLFSAQGTLADVNAVSADLDKIVNGAKFVGDGGARPSPTPSPTPRPAPRRQGPEIHDPLWGVDVAGLDGDWHLTYRDLEYELASGDPNATIKIEYRPFSNKKKYVRDVGSKRTVKLAGHDAVLVEKKNDANLPVREYHVLRDDHAIVISFTSVSFDEAVGVALPEFERALEFSNPAAVSRGKKKGAKLALPHGAHLELEAPWSVEGLMASGAWFSYSDRSTNGRVMVYAWMRPSMSQGASPFDAEITKFNMNCLKHEGKYDEKPITIAGAQQAVRYRCRDAMLEGRSTAGLMILAKGKGANPVYFMLMARYEPNRGETPDGTALLFVNGLNLP